MIIGESLSLCDLVLSDYEHLLGHIRKKLHFNMYSIYGMQIAIYAGMRLIFECIFIHHPYSIFH